MFKKKKKLQDQQVSNIIYLFLPKEKITKRNTVTRFSAEALAGYPLKMVMI